MTKLSVDFSQVEDYAAFPAGTYPVVIESVEIREPKEQGKFPYLNFTLVVADGEYEGRKLWWIGSLAPKALFRLKALFDSFGFEGDNTELDYDPGSGILLTPSFAGLPATAEVSIEEYNKQDRNRVEDLYAGDGTAKLVKATKKSGDVLAKKAPAKPAKVEAEAPTDDDDAQEPDEVTSPVDDTDDATGEPLGIVGTDQDGEDVVEVKEAPKASTKPNPFAPKTGTAPRKVFK